MVKNITATCIECGGSFSFIADIKYEDKHIYILSHPGHHHLISCKYCPSNRFEIAEYETKYKF